MDGTVDVAYSFDDNYAKYAGVSILSLLVNNIDIESINIYIIGDGLSEGNIKNIKKIADDYSRKIEFIDIDMILPIMNVIPSFGKSAYGRLYLASFLNIEKILYFDSDTIVLGSIKGLLNLSMTRMLVAGVQDTVNPFYLRQIGLRNADQYINSGGVLILNLALWREMGVEKKCTDFIEKHDGNPPHNDQGTINNICKGFVKILHPKYNLMNPMFMYSTKQALELFKMDLYYSQERINEALERPVVVHFTSEFFNRPWFKSCTHPMKEKYLEYLHLSPWTSELSEKGLSRNCRIQNWIYSNLPFFVYKMMIRYIELKHLMIDLVEPKFMEASGKSKTLDS
jgi:lipopolysaccharide biosynthesis glycosyltransferase